MKYFLVTSRDSVFSFEISSNVLYLSSDNIFRFPVLSLSEILDFLSVEKERSFSTMPKGCSSDVRVLFRPLKVIGSRSESRFPRFDPPLQ